MPQGNALRMKSGRCFWPTSRTQPQEEKSPTRNLLNTMRASVFVLRMMRTLKTFLKMLGVSRPTASQESFPSVLPTKKSCMLIIIIYWFLHIVIYYHPSLNSLLVTFDRQTHWNFVIKSAHMLSAIDCHYKNYTLWIKHFKLMFVIFENVILPLKSIASFCFQCCYFQDCCWKNLPSVINALYNVLLCWQYC